MILSVWVNVWQFYPPAAGAGEVCTTKLAVKAATDDPSHKQPSHISPVIWTGWEKGEGEKKQLPLPFCMSSLSCMKANTQSSSCYNDSPKTNFPLAQQTQVFRILLPEPHKIVKIHTTLYTITLHSSSVLIKPHRRTYMDSPEATELELHCVLSCTGLKAFCILLNAVLLGLKGIEQRPTLLTLTFSMKNLAQFGGSKRNIPSTYKGHLWPKFTLLLKQSDIM